MANATLVKNLKDVLALAKNRGLGNDELELLALCAAIRGNNEGLLEAFLGFDAANRLANYDKIQTAINVVKGSGFAFTSHGIRRTIVNRFDEEQKLLIVRAIASFSEYLLDKLDLESFVTSATLLGLVRDGKFLPYENSLDLAYVAKSTVKQGIIDERGMLMNLINDHPDYTTEERTGGICTVLVRTDEIKFSFRLFVAFRRGAYLNVYPMAPNKLRYADVSPVTKQLLYGVEVPVPRVPERLLELRYGADWRQPDPAYRYDINQYREHYKFLIEGKFVKRMRSKSTIA
jgi:hypothetical protein